MKKSILILLTLSACGMNDYRPAVSNIKDQGKYEADTQSCIQYSKDVRSKPDARNALMGLSPVAGFVALQATKDKDDEYFMNGYELVDRCMEKRGYTLVNNR
jgi:hypothetical protein